MASKSTGIGRANGLTFSNAVLAETFEAQKNVAHAATKKEALAQGKNVDGNDNRYLDKGEIEQAFRAARAHKNPLEQWRKDPVRLQGIVDTSHGSVVRDLVHTAFSQLKDKIFVDESDKTRGGKKSGPVLGEVVGYSIGALSGGEVGKVERVAYGFLPVGKNGKADLSPNADGVVPLWVRVDETLAPSKWFGPFSMTPEGVAVDKKPAFVKDGKLDLGVVNKTFAQALGLGDVDESTFGPFKRRVGVETNTNAVLRSIGLAKSKNVDVEFHGTGEDAAKSFIAHAVEGVSKASATKLWRELADTQHVFSAQHVRVTRWNESRRVQERPLDVLVLSDDQGRSFGFIAEG